MKIPACLSLVALLSAGCTTPFRAPPEAAHIKLIPVDSPLVVVEKVWLERQAGALAVKGYVVKRVRATDTAHTHLDVTLLDADGAVLRSTVEHFNPQPIATRMNRDGVSGYSVALDTAPAGITRIEVRAHEAPHS